jgi:hypothetical protein
MDWKEFLKPDWRKILIAVLLLFVPIPIRTYSVAIPTALGVPGGFLNGMQWIPLILLSWMTGFSVFSSWLIDDLVIIAISYLLSCSIVWVYDRVRHKK